MDRAMLLLVAVLGISGSSIRRADDAANALTQCRKALMGDSGQGVWGTAVLERKDAAWHVIGLRRSVGTDSDIEQCSKTASLESLDLEIGSHITSAGIRKLASLRNLRQLTARPLVSNDDLQAVGTLSNLDALDLNSFCLERSPSDKSVAPFGKLKNLRRLHLGGLTLGNTSLAYIKSLKHLEELDLLWSKITDAGLTQLKGLETLVVLRFGELAPNGTAALEGLPRLEELEVRVYSPTSAQADLSGLRSLKSLKIRTPIDCDQVVYVRLPENLLRLDVQRKTVSKLNLESCKHLAHIELRGHRGRDEDNRYTTDLHWLRSCRELRVLALDGAYPEDVVAVGGLTSLRAFTMTNECSDFPFNDEAMKALAGLSELESLWIKGASLTDAGIEVLGKFANLRRLGLVVSGDLAKVLPKIWGLKRLHALDLDLGWELIGHVAAIPASINALSQLEELTLRGTLTDEGLGNMAGLKKLRRLDLSKADGYTDRGVASLMRALPKLRVVEVTLQPAQR